MKKKQMKVVISMWHDNMGGRYTCTHDGKKCGKIVLTLSEKQEQLIRKRLQTCNKQPRGTHLHISLFLLEKNEETKEEKSVAGGGTTYVSRKEG